MPVSFPRTRQELNEPGFKSGDIAQFTFPHYHRLPPEFAQLTIVPLMSLNVGSNLLYPVRSVS